MGTSFRMTSFAAAQRMTTAAAAGAVCVIHDQRLVLSLDPSGIAGPAARHFFEFFVYFVDCFVVKILVHSCPFVVYKSKALTC